MANWAKVEPQGSFSRKKWNLEDRASLKNLKYHIAEDGCSDIQYDLARQLLEGESSESDSTQNYSQGIYWLLRAADQGHEEAYLLLAECYSTKRGITDCNECEVQTFLAMSPGERAARKAARELFACLANGGEYITAAQLERKMREIYKIQKNKRRRSNLPPDNDEVQQPNGSRNHVSPSPHRFRRRDLYNPDVITEANLVSAAINYSNGHMPSVSHALSLSVPHPQSLDHIPCFHRLIFHPLQFFLLCYHRFINMFSSFPETTVSHINFLFLLLIYAVVASNSIASIIPKGIYYLSLVVMVVSSVKMLKAKHDFIDFRMWSGLFLNYGDHNVDAEASENQFLRNNMKPYLYFFIAFFANVMLNPLISDQWLPHSEVTVIAFIFVFVTMFAFMYSSWYSFPDWLVLTSFGVNVLAKYPYEMDQVVTTGWRFLDLKVPNFSSFVIGNGIEFCLSSRALLYLVIPGFLVLLALRRNWHGTYQFLIPHCVTLSWLQICIISSQCATMFGLVRAALGLAGLLLFLPLFGIVTLMVPVFAAVEWLSLTDPTVRIVASICVAVVAVIGSCFMAANYRTEKYVTLVQIVVCVVATVFLTFPYMTSNFESSHSKSSSIFDTLIHHHKTTIHQADLEASPLSWDAFYKYCNQLANEKDINRIRIQLRCAQLDGTVVRWEGDIVSVEIAKVSNLHAELLGKYLPPFWYNLIACWYGEENSSHCAEREQCDEINAFMADEKKCNLNKLNTYEYDILVRMQAGGMLYKSTDLVLRVQHFFGNFTQRLNASDRIWFKGFLRNTKESSTNGGDSKQYMTLGKPKPLIDLTAMGCVNCKERDLDLVKLADSFTVNERVKDLYRGLKYLLNVLFNPLVIFK